MTDLGDGQVDEIGPIRRPVDEPKPARRISHPPVIQMAITDGSDSTMPRPRT